MITLHMIKELDLVDKTAYIPNAVNLSGHVWWALNVKLGMDDNGTKPEDLEKARILDYLIDNTDWNKLYLDMKADGL